MKKFNYLTSHQGRKLFYVTAMMALCLMTCSVGSYGQATVPYQWSNAKIGGGGFISGIIYSEAEPGLIYTRTDVGGAYRWDNESKTWIPLQEMVSDFNDHGVLSIAPDPSDANRVYLQVGLYEESWWGTTGQIYASADRGNTWKITRLPFKVGGNAGGRGSGERLQVDPNQNNILFMGSNVAGLWKSIDYGTSWNLVASFPATKITFVELDKTTGTSGSPTNTIYVGTYDHLPNTLAQSIYRSVDGGVTWELLPGQPSSLTPKSWDARIYPAVVNRLAMAGDFIYFSYSSSVAPNGVSGSSNSNGAVYKYNKITGTWADITPDRNTQGGYGGIATSPTNPNLVIVGTLDRWWPQNEFHISGDGGVTWRPVLFQNTWSSTPRATLDHSKHPWANGHKPHWGASIEIDPFNPDKSMFGTGYGLYATENLTQAVTGASHWVFENEGLEEVVPLDLASPPVGPHLVSIVGDVTGFRHDNLTVSAPPLGLYNGTNTTIDFAENNPNIMVRAGSWGTTSPGRYTTDGALTWIEFPSKPANATQGSMAISPNGDAILWTMGGAMYYSHDVGTTWVSSGGVPNISPVADRVLNNTFYAYNKLTGTFYRSTDSGVTFSTINTSFPQLQSWEGGGNLFTIYGQPGHVWLALGTRGLYFSADSGTTFVKIPGDIRSAWNLSPGKAAPGKSYPSLFMYGQVGATSGILRSDDRGVTWLSIQNENQQYGGSYRCLAGDPRIFGRVYVGTQGRGVVYSDRDLSGASIAPVAIASATPTTGFAPFNVSFDGSASYEIEGDSLTYSWDFGDGTQALGITAEHTYTSPGIFSALLTVTDVRGGVDTASVTITSISGLKLQYRARVNEINPTDNHIKPHFKILNTSPNPIPYSELTIRYWYTSEGNVNQAFWCDYALLGTNKVKGKFVKLAPAFVGADYYVELNFASTGAVAAGGNSGEIQTRFNKVNWSNYNESGDYSYDPSKTNYTDWEHVTLYRNGKLFWGVEPSGSASMSATKINLSMYPNPSNTMFTVKLNGSFSYAIVDQYGNSKESGEGIDEALVGKTLLPGLYVLKIYTGDGVIDHKLIKK